MGFYQNKNKNDFIRVQHKKWVNPREFVCVCSCVWGRGEGGRGGRGNNIYGLVLSSKNTLESVSRQ